MCTRKIVGYSYGRKMSADLVTGAVTNAFRNQGYPKGVIIHSDQGSQYTSDAYMNLRNHFGFRVSYSAKGNPLDNAPMESLVPAYAYAPTEAELNEAIMSGALDDVLPSYVIEQYAQESTLQSGFDFVIKVLSSYRI